MALDTKRLLRVGLAKAKDHAAWQEGVSLERDSGQRIEALAKRVAAARIALAKEMMAFGRFALAAERPMHRLVISRSYYCMYHAVRAAAFVHYGGDDHQRHDDLPQRMPNDFPDAAAWGNQLKSAREYRNQADYDPYPRTATYWQPIAASVFCDAEQVLPLAIAYLRTKGCVI